MLRVTRLEPRSQEELFLLLLFGRKRKELHAVLKMALKKKKKKKELISSTSPVPWDSTAQTFILALFSLCLMIFFMWAIWSLQFPQPVSWLLMLCLFGKLSPC